MFSRDELFLRALECYFRAYMPRCLATRDINTKITLSWALKQFVNRVHTLFSISPVTWQWQVWDIYQTFYSEKTPHTSTSRANYKMSLSSFWYICATARRKGDELRSTEPINTHPPQYKFQYSYRLEETCAKTTNEILLPFPRTRISKLEINTIPSSIMS